MSDAPEKKEDKVADGKGQQKTDSSLDRYKVIYYISKILF